MHAHFPLQVSHGAGQNLICYKMLFVFRFRTNISGREVGDCYFIMWMRGAYVGDKDGKERERENIYPKEEEYS